MKTAKVLTAMVFVATSVPFMAQQAAPPDQQSAPPPSARATGAPATAAAAPVEMNPVNGELVDILDSKTAKAGDSVAIKTKSAVKTADGTEIPKGSKLLGHVTGVKASGEGNENSQVSLQFDRAELKDGQSMAIRSELKSLSPAGTDTSAGTTDAMTSSPANSPSGSASSSAPSAGGTNGSAPSAQPGSAASASPNAPAAAQSQNTPAPGAMPNAGTVVARTGNIEIKTTSIPGVLLASNEPGQQDPRMAQSSGILLGAKRDIHLDGGTKVVIGVAAAEANPPQK